ncbi:hypothetical protein NDU88_006581 [Pleurodeles waltl]|uniref:Uncharacterized protein n=1 Tax=Pleurodeles waltl TaxID=8319 RepID=A0AAV7TZW6_PLEWA|nr:hypothetical protein NDU88_006581 [Pleurodeles waltl]
MRNALERRSRVGSRIGPEHLAQASTAPYRSTGSCSRAQPGWGALSGTRGASRSSVQVLGRGTLIEGRGGRVLSLPPLSSARNALERRSRSSAMAAASSRDHRVLRVGRAFRGAVLPELLIMPGSDCTVIPGALGHSRAQDFEFHKRPDEVLTGLFNDKTLEQI